MNIYFIIYFYYLKNVCLFYNEDDLRLYVQCVLNMPILNMKFSLKICILNKLNCELENTFIVIVIIGMVFE
jgi:hypothetical protein